MQIPQEMIRDSVLPQFFSGIEVLETPPYGSGHINDTFAPVLRRADGTITRYILQRINTRVFQDPDGLMENIQGITSYLKEIIRKNGGDPLRETLTLFPTRSGASFFRDPETGFCWRLYLFVENTLSLDKPENTEDFYCSARAFGRFQQLLAGYPAASLHETIPKFHHTVNRLDNLKKAVQTDKMGRLNEVEAEVRFALEREKDAAVLLDLHAAGEIPLRVTHNDTKLNNVLIDEQTRQGICVIDLDTVMPGLAHYDFGDSIRFGANTAAEDETDLSKVSLDLNLFEAYTRGFLEEAGGVLNQTEKELLPMGAKLMTFECGVRFLTDYLEGDVYFKTHREGHNLDRARNQFQLVADMETKWEEMARIIRKYSR